MKKAIAIIRCSSKPQLEKYGPGSQLTDIKESLDYFPNGHTELYQTIELQEPASGWNRKKWEKAMDYCIGCYRQGKAQVVIFPRVDRETRFLAGSFPKLLEVIKSGMLVYFAEEHLLLEPNDPDSFEEYQREALEAQAYIRVLRRNLMKGKRQSIRRSGRWCGGFLKYGYRYEKDRSLGKYTGFLQPEGFEAGVLLTMFQKVDREGTTARKLAKWANEGGIPTKRKGMGWVHQQIALMLRDRSYIGEGYYGKLARKGIKLVKGDAPMPMRYPQIIPEDLFERVQVKLSENKRKNRGATKHDRLYILQHLGRCGECGGSLGCQTVGKHRYLYCIRQLTFPHSHNCYQPKHWHLGMVENYVWGEMEDTLDSYRNDTQELLLDRFESARDERQEQIARAKDELERLKWEKQRVLTTVRKGHVTEDEAEIQFSAIKEEQEHWQQELANLEAVQTNTDAIWDSWWSHFRKIDAMFDWGFNPTDEQKKTILNLLLQEFVLFKDGKCELRFKAPLNGKQVAEAISEFQPCQQTVNYSFYNVKNL